MMQSGYGEFESHRKIVEYNNVAPVVSIEGYALQEDSHPHNVESTYKMAFVNNRWWITNVLWNHETSGSPLPEQFISKIK